MADEFGLIERYFKPLCAPGPTVELGLGDDAAVLSLEPSQRLVVSTDTLVEGVHFPVGADSKELGWRLVSCAVSDLAAMSADPHWLLLSLTLPTNDSDWMDRFALGLAEACALYELNLVGGDTTAGPLTLTAQVMGTVPVGQYLSRSGAQVGDLIYVTGTLGDSRAALGLMNGEIECSDDETKRYLRSRFYRPKARISEGLTLRNIANAAIDISDGFLADLSHLLKASGVGAQVDLDRLPRSTALGSVVDRETAINWAATGGEDFELCFTLPKANCGLLPFDCTEVGVITADLGRLDLRSEGQPVNRPDFLGYNHFGMSQS